MPTLSASDKTLLCTWIKTTKHLKRIFKASEDGLSAAVFHEKCDNKGATVTVCWNTSGCVFGGYTTTAWTSSNTIIADNTTFIFQLYGMEKDKQMWDKVAIGSNLTISHQVSQGPTFGFSHTTNDYYDDYYGELDLGCQRDAFTGRYTPIKHDLICFKDPIKKVRGVFHSNGSVPQYHPILTDVTQNDFNYTEVEVYQVVDKLNIQDEPWRFEIQEKTASIKKKVEDYKPVEGGKVNQSKILLIGCVGSGKSSYFNTINSVFRGHVTSQAAAGSAEHSLTTKFRSYQIRTGSKYLKMRLCDTRGLEESQGVDPGDINAILDGHMPNKYSFNPFAAITPETPGYIKTPSVNDQIHCVAFIIDGSSVDMMNKSILSQFKMIQKLANQRGIPQVIILTKVDEISQAVKQNLSNLFYSSEIAEAVDKVAQLIGLPRGHVLPVKNYEKETELNETVDRFALLSLQQMLRFADDYFEDTFNEAKTPVHIWTGSLSELRSREMARKLNGRRENTDVVTRIDEREPNDRQSTCSDILYFIIAVIVIVVFAKLMMFLFTKT